MPLDLQTFKTRSLTAVLFVIIMLTGLLLNQWSFFILFSIIHFGCWIEYHRLILKIDPDYNPPFLIRLLISMAGWGFMLALCNQDFVMDAVDFPKAGGILFATFFVLYLVVGAFTLRQRYFKNIRYSVAGLCYIALPWGLMMGLWNSSSVLFADEKSLNFGWLIPIILIASIWINDTMAYVVGSFIGKTPFSKISPKKTWEGTAGGALLAVLVVSCCGFYFLKIKNTALLIGLSAIAAIAGTAGDLLESKLKRLAGVKDSGRILPGHGGFLDRFDSLLLATPFAWLYLYLFILS